LVPIKKVPAVSTARVAMTNSPTRNSCDIFFLW
jgi:hypothetical protein